MSSLVDTVHQTRVVELLTRHADAIFGPSDSFITSKRRLKQKHVNAGSEKQTELRKGQKNVKLDLTLE